VKLAARAITAIRDARSARQAAQPQEDVDQPHISRWRKRIIFFVGRTMGVEEGDLLAFVLSQVVIVSKCLYPKGADGGGMIPTKSARKILNANRG